MAEIKSIKNISVSYPDEYTDKIWDELNARKEKLLRSSDWTQLPDCGLSEGCIESWNTWRESLRALTSEKYKNINKVNKLLDHIRAVQPELVYAKRDVDVITSVAMKKIQEHDELIAILNSDMKNVKKDLSEMASIMLEFRKTPQEEPTKPIEITEKFVFNSLKEWYSDEIRDILEFPLNIVMERCEQAIDYKVSNDLEMSPLVKLHSEIHNKTCHDISNMFINDKKELLTKISELDKKYYKLKHTINNSETIENLKKVYAKITEK